MPSGSRPAYFREELRSFIRHRLSSPAALWRFLQDAAALRPLKRRWLLRCRLQRRAIELDITEECDLLCHNCDRACGVAPSQERMSPSQVEKFVDESLALPWEWTVIRVLGGEPTLHPELAAILAALDRYRRRYPSCSIELLTNGRAASVRARLAGLPAWVTVRDSAKTTRANPFRRYNVAPRDLPEYRDADYTKGCTVLETCGLGLNRRGYYPCGAGGAVDRVFGFGAALPSLRAALSGPLHGQLRVLCPCCGHFLRSFLSDLSTRQETSPSWAAALERYRGEPPRLKDY